VSAPDSYVSNLYAETISVSATLPEKASSKRSFDKRTLAALIADAVTCVAVLYLSVSGWNYVTGVHSYKLLHMSVICLIFVMFLYRSRITGRECNFHPLDETARVVKVSIQGLILALFGKLILHGVPYQAFVLGFAFMPIALTVQRLFSRSFVLKMKSRESASRQPESKKRELSGEWSLGGNESTQNLERVVMASRWYSIGKRTIDVCISSILLIVLSPILLLIAGLVRFTSAGPALFAQERVGIGGRLFKIYKFRSMACDAFPYEISPVESSDPRITWIGRFLRKTGLDELPQLINILLGQMSLVGPRPEMPFIVAHYNELQRIRLQVMPGLTGIWQLSVDRAYPIHENLHHDLFYIERRTLTLDLAILVHTLVFAMRGGI
jgi:lipopolysaccharide/colanic/teichoic acid biosynthesis glycosyltransferase